MCIISCINNAYFIHKCSKESPFLTWLNKLFCYLHGINMSMSITTNGRAIYPTFFFFLDIGMITPSLHWECLQDLLFLQILFNKWLNKDIQNQGVYGSKFILKYDYDNSYGGGWGERHAPSAIPVSIPMARKRTPSQSSPTLQVGGVWLLD